LTGILRISKYSIITLNDAHARPRNGHGRHAFLLSIAVRNEHTVSLAANKEGNKEKTAGLAHSPMGDASMTGGLKE